MPLLERRLIVITGAAGNLGRAIVRRAVEEGAQVVVLDRRPDAVDTLRHEPGVVDGVALDLADPALVAAALARAETHGTLWGLAHTVGTWQGGASLADTPPATLELMWAVNVQPAFLLLREALRRMQRGGKGGRIVTIGALTAHEGKNLAGAVAYNTAKAALITMTKGAAEEGRAHGVFANCLAPGTMDTPQNRAAMPEADPARWASLEEVAEVAVSALSPRSGLCGAVLPIPGRG